MPKGPNGQKRPADAIGLAVMIGKIATGEIEEARDDVTSAAAQMGKLGGKARAANMTPERRKEIAQSMTTGPPPFMEETTFNDFR